MTPRTTFLLVTALRWLPEGALLAVLVVFLLERGLDLAQVGVLAAVHAAIVIVLEVPSGGLADAVGRRPVLVLAAVVGAVAFGVTVVAEGFAVLLVAWALQAAFRSLDSGPLEAWYVDRALAADPRHDIQADLARASFWTYGAAAAGALAAGAVGLVPGLPVHPLTAAVALAALLSVLHAGAVVLLVREEPRAREGGEPCHGSPGRHRGWSGSRRPWGGDTEACDSSWPSSSPGVPGWWRSRCCGSRARPMCSGRATTPGCSAA
ncbi:MAG: MFS transporter [Kineosporiaceae bacterium]